MQQFDAVIVGGGPAGSTCAWRLQQAGYDVAVLDKQPFPRDKVCAGWITPAVIDALELDLQAYGAGRTCQPITGFRIGLIGGRATEVRYPEPVSYGIRRCEFDHYLLRRIGAAAHAGTPFQSLRRDGGQWVINEALRTPLLVGAGGHFCPVARRLGNAPGRSEHVVAAQEVEFQLNAAQREQCRIAGEIPELYFCDDLKGYAWCFRKGEHLNVGLGREDNHRLAEHVGRFVDWLKAQGRIPADAPARFKGHAYLLYGHSPRRVIDDGVLLIGDAAGLAYPQSGEGIRPAIESALLAAETLVGAADYRAASLAHYERRLEQRFGTRGVGSPRPGPFGASLKAAAARLLLGSRWFARRIVLERWFLHLGQPPLT